MIKLMDGLKRTPSRVMFSSARKGQMSLVFLLLIAVALVFLAMTMNWGKMAENRTQVSMAAQSGAAVLVSYMASYGENLLQGQLGGEKKKCDWTGLLLGIIILVIAIIIAVIVGIFTAGAGAGAVMYAGIGLFVMACAAVVLAGAAVIIDVAYIQPKMTALWNKMMQNRSVEERFLYAGYQSAFPMAVSDKEELVDIHDFDMDGDQSDMVNRFAYFFTMHMWDTAADPKCVAFSSFQKTLKGVAQALGVDKRATCEDNAACNACCSIKGYRSGTCTDEDIPQICRDTTPYPGYPLVYDPLYLSRTNTAPLLGFVGLDDSRPGLMKNTPNDPLSTETVSPVVDFSGWDSEGRVFPLFWEIKDSQAKVYDLSAPTTTDPGCHWCDQSTLGVCDPSAKRLFQPEKNEKLGTEGLVSDPGQLELSQPFLKYMGGCTNIVGSGLQSDTVDTLSFFIKEGSGCPYETAQLFGNNFKNCASRVSSGSVYKKIEDATINGAGVWRPGSDLFCGDPESSTVPYYGNCTIHTGTAQAQKWCMEDTGETDNCTCSKTNGGSNWHNDDFDDIGTKLRQLSNEVSGIMADEKYCGAANVEEWGDSDTAGPDYTAQKWIDNLQQMSCDLRAWAKSLEIWGIQPYRKNDVWCCPVKTPVDMPDWEKTACAIPGLEGVTTCMESNIDNVEKFVPCEDTCRSACIEFCDEKYDSKGKCESSCAESGGKDVTACQEASTKSRQTCCEEICTDQAKPGTPAFDTCVNGCDKGKTYNKEIAACQDSSTKTAETCCAEKCEIVAQDGNEASVSTWVKEWRDCRRHCGQKVFEAGGVGDYECGRDWDGAWVGKDCPNGEGAPGPSPAYDGNGQGKEFAGMPDGFTGSKQDADSRAAGTCADLPRAVSYHTKNLSDVFSAEGCSSNFVDLEHQATMESINQGKKFAKRVSYLKKLEDGVDTLELKFTQVADTIDANLPAIQTAFNTLKAVANTESSQQSNGIVYAWRSKAPGNQPAENGLWHAVFVQAALPKRCGPPVGNCGTNKFPWVKTYKKAGGFKRCYEIVETEGKVGIQVSRWDESAASGSAFGKLLPSFRFSLAGTQDTTQNTHDLLNACSARESGKDLGAFITGWNDQSCVGLAEKLAKSGYTSKMCGNYWLKSKQSPFSKRGDHTFGLKLGGC